MEIHLEKLTWDTVDAVLKLRVSKEQKGFVAPNSDSIIDAYFALTEEGKNVFPFGIYNGKKAVGFLMIGYDYPDFCDGEAPGYQKNSYLIWRFMIDKNYQRKGYGRAAMQQALELVRSFPCGESEYCWISYEPENEAARNLYLSFGFEEKPEDYVEGEEMPAVMKL